MNKQTAAPLLILGAIFLLALGGYWVYTNFRIDVPTGHYAVITNLVGKNLENNQEVASSSEYKGLQQQVLAEGRYFYNPFFYDWDVYRMPEIPGDKLGVRVRLHGEDLPYGRFVATSDDEKGYVREVLRPGRYAINAVVAGQENTRPKQDYLEIIEIHDPVVVPAGYKGVVTVLDGPLPEEANTLLVQDGERGVQTTTLDPGTYYVNPYVRRVNLVDCRSQRFNLENLRFPSKDGFYVTLDAIIEFRVHPDQAAEVFVTYNEVANDDIHGEKIAEEIINKIILPNARSFCRLRGSDSTGREFIGGETRTKFQEDFQVAMKQSCDMLGIEVIQALVTDIIPPAQIAGPVRDREVARQKVGQYEKQIEQQASEVTVAIEKAMIERKREMVAAEQEVAQIVTKAMEKQEVAVTKANEELAVTKLQQKVAITQAEQRKAVAETRLESSKDEAEAILFKAKAQAEVIELQNKAKAAGWRESVAAFDGDGLAYARYVLLNKLAPGYKQIMSNTGGENPLMDIFRKFNEPSVPIGPMPETPTE